MTITQLKYVIAIASAHSMNEAARQLFISQPSLSAAIHDLEEEIGMILFLRTNRGISLTPDGEEFIGYARQVVEQYALMEGKYITGEKRKKHFAVSSQHYAFAIAAFTELVKQFGMDEYDFAIYETKTFDVVSDVKSFRSEIGILYLNDFNQKVLSKIIQENDLEFHPLMECGIYVYLAKKHPLASKEEVSLEELSEYPYITFDQGKNNSFFFSEEMLSTYQYKQLIRVCDRGSSLNLMVGLNGYTLCSGILCEELNGSEHIAIKLKGDAKMTIGYVIRKGTVLSSLGQKYLEEIGKYKDNVLML